MKDCSWDSHKFIFFSGWGRQEKSLSFAKCKHILQCSVLLHLLNVSLGACHFVIYCVFVKGTETDFSACILCELVYLKSCNFMQFALKFHSRWSFTTKTLLRLPKGVWCRWGAAERLTIRRWNSYKKKTNMTIRIKTHAFFSGQVGCNRATKFLDRGQNISLSLINQWCRWNHFCLLCNV